MGSLLFCPPFFLLISNHGTGLYSLIFVVTALFYWTAARAPMARHRREVCTLLLAFAPSLVLALATYLLNGEVRLRDMEKPVRMVAAIAALATVLACRPPRRFLWWGLIAGAVAGALFISYQRWVLGMDRPGGLINSITFGDLSLCMGLMCLAASLDFQGRQALWPGLGMFAGMVGSIASGTRGGWVAILFCSVLLVKYGQVLHGRGRKAMALLALALVAVTFLLPHSGARERMMEGVGDVRAYFNGGDTNTNVGTRLELWRGGAQLVKQHPWFGASVAEVKREKAALVARGVLPGFVLQFDHFHNDALQALVMGGLAGLLAWACTLLLPFLFFLRQLHHGGREVIAPALAGVLLVLNYFSFGLTEVIFWTDHSAVFYALTVFTLAGLCLNAPVAAAAPVTTRKEAACI